MVDADHLRIVFWVNGVGFVMPVADLLVIRGTEEDEPVTTMPHPGAIRSGSMVYRDTDVPVYDLASLFRLDGQRYSEAGPLLVFAGSEGPWAVKVDRVSGVVDASRIKFRDLPGYLFADADVLYHQVALYDEQLLVSVEPRQVGDACHRSK